MAGRQDGAAGGGRRTAADVENVTSAGEEAAAVLVEGTRHYPVCAPASAVSVTKSHKVSLR